jgi:hypothetical protein
MKPLPKELESLVLRLFLPELVDDGPEHLDVVVGNDEIRARGTFGRGSDLQRKLVKAGLVRLDCALVKPSGDLQQGAFRDGARRIAEVEEDEWHNGDCRKRKWPGGETRARRRFPSSQPGFRLGVEPQTRLSLFERTCFGSFCRGQQKTAR